MSKRLGNTLRLDKNRLLISSNEVDQGRAEIHVKVRLTMLDRCWQFLRQGTLWVVGGFRSEDKPVWLQREEWFWMLTALDTRVFNANDVWLMEAVPRKGTGFMGLCEYDLEEAVRSYLLIKGIEVEPEFLWNNPKVTHRSYI
jgi:hypothetical protein